MVYYLPEWARQPVRGSNMLIPESFRRHVGFLYAAYKKEEDRLYPLGTAFFLTMCLDKKLHEFATYLVTARHLLGRSREYGLLYLKLNTHLNKVAKIELDTEHWIEHDKTDLAILPWAHGRLHESYEHEPLFIEDLATEKYIKDKEIGIGDDVFFVGMNLTYQGEERCEPIIRFGNISCLPCEKVPARLDPDPYWDGSMERINAYLVEARSWGGHSGSPAFVYFPFDRRLDKKERQKDRWKLLGMVQGHYEFPRELKFIDEIAKTPHNTGMAVIIPAQDIYELVMRKDVEKDRQKRLVEYRKAIPVPTLDMMPTSFTKDKFVRDLKKASKRIKSD